ncbi:MAG: N-acetylmuramoyl-L-alanine amidase [FCB group bacterium]|nr:N-acetylmuramoyl-L-alanine amidase [FCB group bacterium]
MVETYPVNEYQPDVNHDNSIVFFGQLFDIGVRVVKWYEYRGLNGYLKKKKVIREEDRKTGKMKTVRVIKGKRYGGRFPRTGRKAVDIRQFMIHHTGGYLPGVCFNTLHNERRLSVQFIQADNGTIYQTMDAKEIAWHGGKQNRCSIGVECCLYPRALRNPEAYRPEKCRRLGLTPHETGNVYTQGKHRTVFMMPNNQVEALAHLAAGVWFARNKVAGFINRAPGFPTRVDEVLPDPDFDTKYRKHNGLVIHANVAPKKWDATGLDLEPFEDRVGDIYYSMKAE